jgi:signal transduction histidine kinase/CHASE3 domain sensor protein
MMPPRLDLSVGRRLAAGFGVVIALMAALGVVALVAANRVQARLQHQTAVVMPRADAADALEVAVLRVAVSGRNYMVTRAAPDRAAFERDVTAMLRRHEALAALARDEDRAAADEMKRLLQDYQTRLDAFVRLGGASAAEPRWGQAEQEAASAREAVLEKLRAYAADQRRTSDDARAEVSAATNALVSSIGAVTILVLAFGVVSASLVARSVRRPVREIVGAANALRAGDFEPALALEEPAGRAGFRDELREAAAVFRRMAVTLRDREARLGAQARLGAVLAANLSPVELASDALREVAAHVGAEVGAIYVAEADGDRGELLRPLGTFALSRSLPAIRIGDGLAGQAAADQRTYVVQDVPPDTPYVVDLGLGAIRPQGVAAVPMHVGKRVLGVIVVGSVRRLAPEAVEFLEEAAGLVAVSIENALAHERIEALATTLQERNERLHAQNEELQAQGEELQVQSEELQAQNEELQVQGEELRAQSDELRRQRDQLDDRNARLADAEARRDRFFAVLGHELRNPVSVIANAVRVLAGPSAAEEESAARSTIQRQVWRLSRLLDELLDTARLSSGKIVLSRRPLDLGEAVAQSVRTGSSPAETPRHDIRLDVRPAWIDADEARVEQIVANVVGNAMKFTPPGGTIEVSVAVRDGFAELVVTDTGVGIRPEFLPRVFDAFTQDNGDRSGLGLGLTLVKQLVELHGGHVEVTSPGRNRGTTVRVRIPSAAAGSAAVPGGAVAAPAPPRSILLVEDNADARAMLRLVLEREGHTVHEAADGPSGVEAARWARPDAALVDLDLPGFDGCEVARRLRGHGSRLIAISGYGRAEDRRRALEAGFDDHLVKPVDLDRLREILRAMGA